jgi:ribosomal protein L32
MDYIEALSALSEHPHIEQYRAFTADSDSKHEGWRRHVIALAGGKPAPERKQSYPPITTQLGNFWRSMKGFVKSGGKLAPKAVRAERLRICQGCEHYDTTHKRCRKCGCRQSAKVWVASDRCPLDAPKWRAYTGHEQP